MARMDTPLNRAYGAGSAHDGVAEWWQSRLTSLALIPLGVWWMVEIILHAGADYLEFVTWVHRPVTSILLIATILVTAHHTALGLQVVVEDYVHAKGLKIAGLVAIKFGCLLLGVAGIFAVLRLAVFAA